MKGFFYMIAEYKKCFNDLYGSSLHSKKCDNKNPQCFEYYKNQEIAVKMLPFVTSAICTPDNTNNEKEGLYGRGLFHYSKWWERSEVDIFVNGNILTGIPILTDKNTLRVINGSHSYFIPLEKVDYIRTTDGLESCSNT